MREDTSMSPFTLICPRSSISNVFDSWVGSFAKASAEAVSYTHLDVYKRQDQYGFKWFFDFE